MTARLPRHHIEGFSRTSVDMTALPNQHVLANTAANALEITMPPNPRDGDVVKVAEAFETPSFGTNAVTMTPNTGQTIESVATFAIDVDGMLVEFVYDLANTNWDVVHAPGVSSGNVHTHANKAELDKLTAIPTADGTYKMTVAAGVVTFTPLSVQEGGVGTVVTNFLRVTSAQYAAINPKLATTAYIIID